MDGQPGGGGESKSSMVVEMNQLAEKMSLPKVNSFRPFLLYTASFFSLRWNLDSLKSTANLTFGLHNSYEKVVLYIIRVIED